MNIVRDLFIELLTASKKGAEYVYANRTQFSMKQGNDAWVVMRLCEDKFELLKNLPNFYQFEISEEMYGKCIDMCSIKVEE